LPASLTASVVAALLAQALGGTAHIGLWRGRVVRRASSVNLLHVGREYTLPGNADTVALAVTVGRAPVRVVIAAGAAREGLQGKNGNDQQKAARLK